MSEDTTDPFRVMVVTAQDLRMKAAVAARHKRFMEIVPDRILNDVLTYAVNEAERGGNVYHYNLNPNGIMGVINDMPGMVSSFGGADWFRSMCRDEFSNLLAYLKERLEGRGFGFEISQGNTIDLSW